MGKNNGSPNLVCENVATTVFRCVFGVKSCFCDIVIFVISKFCNPMAEKETWYFNPLPLRDAFNTFANRADPDQAALVRAA